MFKLLKKFFQKEKPILTEEVKLKELGKWLKNETAKLDLNSYIPTYFNQIKEIKSQLQEKVKILQEQEISETDQKQVEERVKNIVLGHKNHYAGEIERFIHNISVPEKENFSTIEDYQEANSFNQKIDQEIDLLAKRTAKSYQAAQHLFFKPVEDLFKLLGELNKLVKEFEKKIKNDNIEELEKIQELIFILNTVIKKKKNLEEDIEKKNKKLTMTNAEKEKEDLKLKTLNESEDCQKYLKLKDEKSVLDKQLKDVEYEIFSFFSKLNKPLKKYERVALDNKIIKKYLDDSVKAFQQDEELGIVVALSSLKKSLDSLQFDDKQKNNFLKLIEKSEQGYLQELIVKVKKIEEERKKLSEEIKDNKIIKEIEDQRGKIKDINSKLERSKAESANLQSTFNKINLEKNKTEIVEKVKEVLEKEVIVG